MKKLYVLLFLCSLSNALQAQDYRPLHDSVYLQFQLKNLTIGSGPNFAHIYPDFLTTSGGDSIFSVSANCTSNSSVWPLGDQFIKFSSPHRYGFIGIYQDTCYIHTDYQQGVTWQYYKEPHSTNPAVTATFVDKELYTFSGVSDSVLVIKLSTGDSLRISKHYGICNFKSLFSYYSPICCYLEEDTITLVSMSNTPVQQPIYNPLEVFQYLPGESLYYKVEYYNRMWNAQHTAINVTTTYSTYKLVVTNKTIDADTVYYDFNWYAGLQYQNGPNPFQLKVTTEEAVVVSGITFFPVLEPMFSSSQCDVNFYSLVGSYVNIYKTHDQSTDDDYIFTTWGEQGESSRYWYDTDNGYFQYQYTLSQNLTYLIELAARFPPGTIDPDNEYLTAVNDEQGNQTMRLYPVPCNDQLTIEGTSLANTKIEITTINGTNISATQYSISGNTISTGNLKSGVYILYLKNDSNVLTKMFVKE